MKFSRDSVRTGGVGDLETTELDRRSADSVRHHGQIKEVDYKSTPPRYRAEFGDSGDPDNYILTDWHPAGGTRAQGDTDTHFLEIGERVSMHSENGEFSTAHFAPAGIYTQDDDRKAGTDKAGKWIKKTKNGQEQSFDRETGEWRIIGKGKKKDDSGSTGASGGATSGGGDGSSSGTDAGSGSGAGGSGGDKEIKGSAYWELGGGTLSMKEGVFEVKFGGDSITFKQGSFKASIGGKTIELSDKFAVVADTTVQGKVDTTSGDITNEGKSIGSQHKHLGVKSGGETTQGPV